MPSSTDLPESLAEFSRRQAFPLSDLRWRDEIEELAARLARLSPALDRAFRARVAARNPADTGPAIRETADRVFDQVARRPATPPHQQLWTPRLLRWLAARAKKLITIAIVLAIAYIVIREFGGPQLNSFLDRFVTRTIDTLRNVTTRDP
jgi:hypothetical protein